MHIQMTSPRTGTGRGVVHGKVRCPNVALNKEILTTLLELCSAINHCADSDCIGNTNACMNMLVVLFSLWDCITPCVYEYMCGGKNRSTPKMGSS